MQNLHTNIQKLKNLKILASFWVNNPFMGKNLDQKPKFEKLLQDLETMVACHTTGRPIVRFVAGRL